MPLTDEDKKSIMTSLLENVSSLEDKEYQINAWIKGVGIGTDYTETACQFFDVADPVLVEYKDFGITEDQKRLLTKFRDEFNTFNGKIGRKYMPKDFVFRPECENIRKMAKEVLHAFDYNQIA